MARWLDNHNPASKSHRLHLKNLFIYPTKLGWAFLGLAVIIWLLGTNYQNNLILALSYFQVSLFTVSILRTYYNLSGLKITFLSAHNVFCGESAEVRFAFENAGNRKSNHIWVYFDDRIINTFEFPAGEVHREVIMHPTSKRGKQKLRRLRLESRYPMGLIKCGSWLRFDDSFLVYPSMKKCVLPVSLQPNEASGEYRMAVEPNEFYGFKNYAPGAPLSSIAWKQWARDRGLLTISYANQCGDNVDLSWDEFFRGDKELALSQLSYWIVTLFEQGEAFTVNLRSRVIPVGVTESDLTAALSELALFK